MKTKEEPSENDLECAKISGMSIHELLDYVLCYPDYLTDPHYRIFGTAIIARAKEFDTKPVIRVKMGRRLI